MVKKSSPKWLMYRFRHRKNWGGCCDSHWEHETYRYEDDPSDTRRCWMCGASNLKEGNDHIWR